MGETYVEPASASYRDEVTELMQAGEPFEAVVDAIDAAGYLSEGAKAELWLLALSLSPGNQAPVARRRLAARG
jgi:hypothetical protein